jgi:tyrosyl-tRNA synthetase
LSEKIKFPSVKEQMEIIERGTSEIIPKEELIKKLEKSIESGKPLNIKLG